MLCVLEDAQGKLEVANPQPADITTCSMVVGTYSEMANPLWQLSPSEGAQIAGAILALWAIAWVFRMVARSLSIDEREVS